LPQRGRPWNKVLDQNCEVTQAANISKYKDKHEKVHSQTAHIRS